MLLRATAARLTANRRRTRRSPCRSIFSASTSAPRDGRSAVNDLSRPERVAAGMIGQALPRKEAVHLITGDGRFSDDIILDGQGYAAMVRSPYPHARILGVDPTRSRAMAGVLGVFSGADCAADGLGPIPHNPLPSTRDDMKLTGPGGGTIFEGPNWLLPTDKARHVGEAVAMVVAETSERATDAAESLEVEYEQLPWVTHSEDALEGGAPSVWDEAPGNLLGDTVFGVRQATVRALAKAERVVKMKIITGQCTAVAIDHRSAVS